MAMTCKEAALEYVKDYLEGRRIFDEHTLADLLQFRETVLQEELEKARVEIIEFRKYIA